MQEIWLKRVLQEVSQEELACVFIKVDNSSTLKLLKNPVMHGWSKHIDIRFHFRRNKEGEVELVFCKSEDQEANILTKPLKVEAFSKTKVLDGIETHQCVSEL